MGKQTKMKKEYLLIYLLFVSSLIVFSQDNSSKKLKLFVEGKTFDFNYMRNNTPFADFVNDPQVSDIHVIIAEQSTGGGGKCFTIEYNTYISAGIPNFKLSCYSMAYDTDEIIRQKLVKSLHSGLLPFLNEKNGLDAIQISHLKDTDLYTQKRTSELHDPWKQWVFRLNADAGFNGEEQKQNLNYSFSGRARKVSDALKLSTEYDYDRREGTIKKESGNIVNTLKVNQDADVKLVLSIDPHWSYGLFIQGTQSTYRNIRMALEAMPAVQYNFNDWLESDRRTFTFSYYVGPGYNRYYETTILAKNSEWLWKESFEINLNRVETWGELDIWLEGGHYFPNFDNYYYEAGVDLSFRISKTLSIYFELQTESIHNQIYLPTSELSDEELLLNTRKLPTTYEYSGNIGIRFQFGSIYNNIVNERL